MAWYGMGLRAINIADPYHPVEVGFYEYIGSLGSGLNIDI